MTDKAIMAYEYITSGVLKFIAFYFVVVVCRGFIVFGRGVSLRSFNVIRGAG